MLSGSREGKWTKSPVPGRMFEERDIQGKESFAEKKSAGGRKGPGRGSRQEDYWTWKAKRIKGGTPALKKIRPRKKKKDKESSSGS